MISGFDLQWLIGYGPELDGLAPLDGAMPLNVKEPASDEVDTDEKAS